MKPQHTGESHARWKNARFTWGLVWQETSIGAPKHDLLRAYRRPHSHPRYPARASKCDDHVRLADFVVSFVLAFIILWQYRYQKAWPRVGNTFIFFLLVMFGVTALNVAVLWYYYGRGKLISKRSDYMMEI